MLIVMLVGAINTQECSQYQIKLDQGSYHECVDCNSLMHGCSQCEMINRDYFNLTGAPAIQCTACDYSMYLLAFESKSLETSSTRQSFV